MDSTGELFGKGGPEPRARLLAEYERMRREGFERLGRFSDDELYWLIAIHDRWLDAYREERRMHFGAFALVALALVVVLPHLLDPGRHLVPLTALAGLLILLLVPYTVIYRRYEEGFRRGVRQSLELQNERLLRSERDAQADGSAKGKQD